MTQRYWVGWLAELPETEPPFVAFETGIEIYADLSLGPRTYVAVIDAPSAPDVWGLIKTYYPDMTPRFCEPRDLEWLPAPDRFGEPDQTAVYTIEEPSHD